MKNQKNKSSVKKGFTLIELVVVIGILAVLLTIVLIAINPARQFAQANDAKRRSDVNAILNAVTQYAADKKGDLPGGTYIPTTPTAAKEITGDTDGLAFCNLLVPTYISALPKDPSGADDQTLCIAGFATGYKIIQDTNGRVTVSATAETPGVTISVTR